MILALLIAIGSAGALLELLLYVMRQPPRAPRIHARTAIDTQPVDRTRFVARGARVAMVLVAVGAGASLQATPPDPVDQSIERFLARNERQHAYRASRRLEAANG